MNTLDGKICIVTGAGKGIGKAIAKRFIEENAKGVVIFEWNLELAEATAKELDPSGERCIAVKVDVSNKENVQQAVDVVMTKFGTIDVLVNNAGITKDGMFHKMPDDNWNAVMNVNLGGVYNTCRIVAPIMRDKGYGRIVNISSTSYWGNIGQCNYSASKGAIQGFTASLAKEMAGKGVIVNAVAPGFINTDMYAEVPEEKQQNTINTRIPMHRLADPSELAAVVNFLAGPDVSYMTGQVLVVSGGTHCMY